MPTNSRTIRRFVSRASSCGGEKNVRQWHLRWRVGFVTTFLFYCNFSLRNTDSTRKKLSQVLLDFANPSAAVEKVGRNVRQKERMSVFPNSAGRDVTSRGFRERTTMPGRDASPEISTTPLILQTQVGQSDGQHSQPSHILQLWTNSLDKARQRLLPLKGKVDSIITEYSNFLKFLNASRSNGENDDRDGNTAGGENHARGGHRKGIFLYERSVCTPQWFPKEFHSENETILILSRPSLPLSFQITETALTCIIAAFLDKEPDRTRKYLDKTGETT